MKRRFEGSGTALAVFVVCAGGILLSVSCGGSVNNEATGGVGGHLPDGMVTGGFGGTGAGSGFGGTGASGGFGGTGGFGATGATGGSGGIGGYVDPGCPDAAPPPPLKECDPFGKPTGCSFGEACYPFVDYPDGPCDQEQYGTVCAPAGTGTQGDPCGSSMCAAGHVCVITGVGTQCVQLCPLVGADNCPAGLFCVPIDVEGFGGCF